MASKKNPFASLLQSGRRVQAADFNKDYTVTSTVGQAGNYAIGFTRPIPVSETSMGRLAQALGQTSGILKEFSDYQIKKDQLALQKQQLATQLEGQNISAQQAELEFENAKLRGAMTNETIKQQNIRLEMLEEQNAITEYNAMVSMMSPQERKEHYAQVEERQAAIVRNTERAEELNNEAERNAIGAIVRSGDKNSIQSIQEILSGRRQGAALLNEYNSFAQERFIELMAGVTDTLTDEEAFSMGEQILEEFAESKGLENGSLKAQGFYRAVKDINKKKFAEIAEKALEKAKRLKLDNKGFNLLSVATDGDGILTHDQFTDLQEAAADGTFFPILMGLDGKSGLFQRVKNTGSVEALENFKHMHQAMGYMDIDGKTYKETSEYSDINADIDDAIQAVRYEKRQAEKVREAETSDKLAGLTSKAAFKNGTELVDINAALAPMVESLRSGDANSARKALINTLSAPEELINEIPDDKIFQTVENVLTQYNAASQNKKAFLGQFIQEHTKYHPYLGEFSNFKNLLIEIGSNTDPFTDRKYVGTAIKELVNPKEGNFNQGHMSRLNQLTGGAIDDYDKEAEALQREFSRKFAGDFTSKEAKEFLANGLETAKKNLSSRIVSYFEAEEQARDRVKTNNIFGLQELNKPTPYEQFKEPLFRGEEFQFELLSDKLEAFETTRKAADASTLDGAALSKGYKEYNEFAKKSAINLKRTQDTLEEAASLVLRGDSINRKEGIDDYEDAKLFYTITKEADISRRGLTAQEAKDFAISAYVNKTATRLPALLIDEQFTPQKSAVPSIGGGLGGGLDYLGGDFDEDYEEGQRNRANQLLSDATISRDLFMKFIPPLTDLQFGQQEPSSEEDVKRAVEQLEGVDTTIDLERIANLYGFYTPLEFLQAQYKTLYHTSRNKLNKQ